MDFIKLVQIFIMVTIQASPFTMLMLVHKYALSMCRNHVLRNRILIIILSFILAIVSVEILKIVFGRTGPNDYLATGIHEFRYFQGSMTLSSFPSVYCAGAGAIAATYWIILPPYRLTIILLSLLGLGSQVATEAVFLSDGLAGFVVGTISFLGLKKLFHTRRAVLVETE